VKDKNFGRVSTIKRQWCSLDHSYTVWITLLSHSTGGTRILLFLRWPRLAKSVM